MLTLQIASRHHGAQDVAVVVLADPQGGRLPSWEPGAHIDVQIDGPAGPPVVRQYSLCGDPGDAFAYRIAVLLEPDGSGGSKYLHESVRPGQLIRVSEPRNLFDFAVASRLTFVAGGIGITPILPMLAAADEAGAQWVLHYSGRARSTMAFLDELDKYGDRVRLYESLGNERLVVPEIVDDAAGSVVYACGPPRLLDALESEAEGTATSVKVERFINENLIADESDDAFDVELSITGKTLRIEPGESILERVVDIGVPAPSSCRGGTCGTCETFVLEGEPDHRDAVLNPREREESEVMMICVSRSKGERLVLEL